MIKVYWEKFTGSWGSPHTKLKIEVETDLSGWDLGDLDSKEITKDMKEKIETRIRERIVDKVVREIEYEFDDKIKTMIAEQMLKDPQLKKMIKQSFVDHAKKLLGSKPEY